MGVHIGEATGERLTLLYCRDCRLEYEIDETTGPHCPVCGRANYLLSNTDFSGPWRRRHRTGSRAASEADAQ